MLREELGPEPISIMKEIKIGLDPKGLMNQGKIFD
jgi:FAD/FMN-containing dehydrogenase